MNREEKSQIIGQIKERADKASIALVTDFKGLSAEEITDLRAKIREAGAEYQVVKNTLARIGVADTDHDILKEHFKDNCAVAFGYDDPVALAKAVSDYAKTSKTFALKYGSLEGKFLSEADLKALADLPSKDQLLGKLLGTMNAVPTNFVGLFANLLRNFLYALNAIKDQKEAN